MNKLIFALIGMVVGAAGGYFVAYKRYQKKLAEELEAIKKTQKEVAARAEEKVEVPPEEDGNGKVDVTVEAATEDEDEDYGIYEGDERELELDDARKEFLRELRERYEDTGSPYNITEEEYSTPSYEWEKDVLMIDTSTDRAYLEDGTELDDWHDAIGDRDYGTLDDDRKDEYGHIYVRSPREGKDFEITWSHIELAH